jgi:hypothetical protein
MRLPGIDYGAVPSVGGAYEQRGEAAQAVTGVIAEGFAAMGRELVKTRSQKASADVDEGIAALEHHLAATPYVSAGFVREQLGPDFESLPEPVREQLTRQHTDPASGVTYDIERDAVPTWLVADAIYEKRARDLVHAAAAGIPGKGWQRAFQEAAFADLRQRRAKVAHDSMAAMLKDQQQTQHATIQQFVRLGAHDRALEVIEQSNAWTPGEKALLVEDVLKVRKVDDLVARAEQAASEIEAAHPGDPQAAMKAAQAVPGELGVKVQQRVGERDRLREEAQNDEVRERKGRLELGVRTSQLTRVPQLEQLEDYRRLPEWAQADIVAIMGSVAEQRLRLSQLSSEKEWSQELSRFQGLSDREKVQSWPAYQAKVPFAYSGQFAQVAETARVRLTNAWDTEDVQKTFDLAAGSMKWTTGPKKVRADRVRERGRRWYDAETIRRKGIPPSQPEAAKWLAEQLQYGDQNGDEMFGGGARFRYEAEAEAERTGEPVRFVPYNPEEQKYGPAAVLLRGGAAPGAPQPAAAPVPASAPAPAGPAVGKRARSEELGLPPGGVFEMQANGKWKRVQ